MNEAAQHQNETPVYLEWLSTLEFSDCLDKIFSFISSQITVKNLVWIDQKELEKVNVLNLKERSSFQNFGVAEVAKLYSLNPVSVEMVRAWTKENLGDKKLLSGLQHCGESDSYIVIEGPQTGELLGVLWVRSGKPTTTVQTSNLLSEHHHSISRCLEICQEAGSLKMLSYYDDLTELFNQRYLNILIDSEIEKSKELGIPFSLLFIDVDHFKSVNDRLGHWVGSQVLIRLGQFFSSQLSEDQIGFRYGGDEFMILMMGATVQEAYLKAEELRVEVEKEIFIVDENSVNITVSIGLASCPEHASTRKDIIEMADKAMYYGKNKCRNVVYKA